MPKGKFSVNISLIHPEVGTEWIADPSLAALQDQWFALQSSIRDAQLRRCGATIPSESAYTPSSGLLILGAIARKMGHDVQYFEQCYHTRVGNWDATIEEICSWSDIVCVTGMTVNIEEAYRTVERIKCTNPRPIIIMGGPHVTYAPDEALSRGADCVVTGEGESAWREFLMRPPGSRDGCKVVLPGRPQVLKDIPLPAFDLLNEEIRRNCEIHVFASRGCLNRCLFCSESHFFGKHRIAPVSHVVETIEHALRWRPGLHSIYFSDSQFPMDVTYLETLHDCMKPLLASSRSPHFRCMVRADTVTEPAAKALAELGCVEVCVGVESGDDVVLDRARKNEATDTIANALRCLAKSIPLVRTSWMIGLPGTNEATVEKTITLMECLFRENLITEASFRMFIPYPGTWFFDHAADVGMEITTRDWSSYGRRHFPPPYRLQGFSNEAIYRSYVRALEASIVCMSALANRLKSNTGQQGSTK
jgi:radical SAM superfamily enzyme YgiQ (UPF0313 family)